MQTNNKELMDKKNSVVSELLVNEEVAKSLKLELDEQIALSENLLDQVKKLFSLNEPKINQQTLKLEREKRVKHIIGSLSDYAMNIQDLTDYEATNDVLSFIVKYIQDDEEIANDDTLYETFIKEYEELNQKYKKLFDEKIKI